MPSEEEMRRNQPEPSEAFKEMMSKICTPPEEFPKSYFNQFINPKKESNGNLPKS